MAQKTIFLPDIGEVVIRKRKGAKSIRLSVSHDGQIRLSMPTWSPYAVGMEFVRSKSEWLQTQSHGKGHSILKDGDRIGKAHRIVISEALKDKISTRVTETEIQINIPAHQKPEDKEIQACIRSAALKALKQEASKLLPQRLESLAAEHGFRYTSVSIKQLKARWGSCNSHKQIALSSYLMQLPWELIDYVLLHELVHTRIMAHGKPFWDELSKYVSHLPRKRKIIRTHRPALMPQA